MLPSLGARIQEEKAKVFKRSFNFIKEFVLSSM